MNDETDSFWPPVSITTFLQDTATKKKKFGVPYAYVTPAMLQELRVLGCTCKSVPGTVEHFVFPCLEIGLKKGNRYQLAQAALRIIYGATERALVSIPVEAPHPEFPSVIYPLVVLQDVALTFELGEIPDETREMTDRRVAARKAYLPLLTQLAQCLGVPLQVHQGKHDYTVAQLQPNDGTIHILLRSRPPGGAVEKKDLETRRVFGEALAEDDAAHYLLSPTHGRGRIVKDATGQAVAQVVGNTWYLLVPVMSVYHGEPSERIFSHLLAAMLAAHSQGAPVAQPARLRNYQKTVKGWLRRWPENIQRDIAHLDESMESVVKTMAQLLQVKHEYVAHLERLHARSYRQKAFRRLRGDFALIQAHALVAEVVLVDDALQIVTKPIQIEHEGAWYSLGSYTIFLAMGYTVSVWSNGPTHPKGEPHPHISAHGGPCYGNAGLVIAQALADLRCADTVSYVLQWLAEGYTPALATIKIEEWPKVNQEVRDV